MNEVPACGLKLGEVVGPVEQVGPVRPVKSPPPPTRHEPSTGTSCLKTHMNQHHFPAIVFLRLCLLPLLLMPTAGLADPALPSLQEEFRQATQHADAALIFQKGRLLIPLLEQQNRLEEASHAAIATAFAADSNATCGEAAAAAEEALRLVGAARAGQFRPWDWMLQSQMAGIAMKHRLAEGKITAARRLQSTAWEKIQNAMQLETGTAWRKGQPLPPRLSESTLAILLRTARHETELLNHDGRNALALESLRQLDSEVEKSRMDGGPYRRQIISAIAEQEKFLGHWQSGLKSQARLLNLNPTGSPAYEIARLNIAYWRSQSEGPLPELLQEARLAHEARSSEGRPDRQSRRILAKMAFAYKDAGFDIGELTSLVEEARNSGDRMEAFFARRDLAVIQREKQDFPQAEANLLTALAEVRAIGRKSSEPALYREYGVLLRDSGRPQESIRMLLEAIRLTHQFQWTQHLPPLYHYLASAQRDAGDIAGLKATLATLQSLLESGKLEPERCLAASVAMALCLQMLDHPEEARASLQAGIFRARSQGVPKWQISRIEGDWLAEFEPAQPLSTKAPRADLQPLRIQSHVLPGELARARFTLSNPTGGRLSGTISVEGAHLAADWDDKTGTGRITLTGNEGAPSLGHKVSLAGGEEYLIITDAPGAVEGRAGIRWAPDSGTTQQVEWHIARTSTDGVNVAITNASLAGHNAFYALRLHHALSRRSGDASEPVDLRVISSIPVRIEYLSAGSGELLAVDANGNGALSDPGDLLISDASQDGFADLLCPAGAPVEVALLVYPLVTDQPMAGKELTLDVQLRGTSGWETAAKDVLKN